MSTTNKYFVAEYSGTFRGPAPVADRETFTRVVNRLRALNIGWQLVDASGIAVDETTIFGSVQWPVLIGKNAQIAKRGKLSS